MQVRGDIGYDVRAKAFTVIHGPISVFSKFKAHFDELMSVELRRERGDGATLPRWTIHDLRRTGRSLMSQAGISPDHAERALGLSSPACGASMTAMISEMRSGKHSKR